MRIDAQPLKKGERFGFRVSLGECKMKRTGQEKRIRRYEKMICDCGSVKRIRRGELRGGKSKSCGCKRNEELSKKATTHGKSNTRFYKIYRGILGRCNYNYLSNKNYFGKGIKCEWNSFKDFKNDMWDEYQLHSKKFGEENTTLDRIDNNGNYCKENCRWATWKEQENNRTNNWKSLYGIDSETLSKETGLSKHSLQGMLYRNDGDFDKFIKRLEKRFNKIFIYKKQKDDIDMS